MSDRERLENLEQRVGQLHAGLLLVGCLVLVLLVFDLVDAAEKLQQVPTPISAATWALSDLAAHHPQRRAQLRYLWLPPWADDRWPAAVAYGLNTAAGTSHLLHQPQSFAGGWMLRVDLAQLAHRAGQRRALAKVWDDLARDDPYFHVRLSDRDPTPKAAIISPAIEGKLEAALVALGYVRREGRNYFTLRPLPVYRADWFLSKILSTLNGGVYYDLLRILSTGEGSEEEQILAGHGINETASFQIGGSRRVGLVESQVTGKPRSIVALRGFLGQGWITEDLTDEQLGDARVHPLLNLLPDANGQGKFAAREGILERANGLHSFYLSDDAGALVDEAPASVATDRTVPPPHTQRLQPAISCLRCHSALSESDEGLKPAPNDIRLALGRRLDVLADRAERGEQADAVARLADLYAGDFRRSFARARDDVAEATFTVTGGLGVQAATQLVTRICDDYLYRSVTTRQAALEIGWRSQSDPDVLHAVLDDKPVAGQFAVEDGIVGFLREGLAVRRGDFERVYGELLYRATYGTPPAGGGDYRAQAQVVARLVEAGDRRQAAHHAELGLQMRPDAAFQKYFHEVLQWSAR